MLVKGRTVDPRERESNAFGYRMLAMVWAALSIVALAIGIWRLSNHHQSGYTQVVLGVTFAAMAITWALLSKRDLQKPAQPAE